MMIVDIVDQHTIMLVALIGNTIPPKMKQGGKKKPVQTAKIEKNCDKSVSPDWYVLLFVD
jgi:hypothetical protein